MGGFPIRINEISGSSSDNKLILGIDITLSLIGEKDGGFAANGRFKIISEAVEGGSNLSYKFKTIEIERFGINIDKGSFKFKGTLNFYKEDALYGNGISGTVDATFQPAFQVQASAIFGSKDGYRYWFADALLTIKSGVTIFTGVAIYTFGGGAYYHMILKITPCMETTRLRLAEMASADSKKISNILLKNMPFIEFKINNDEILSDVRSEKVKSISSLWNGKHVQEISRRLFKTTLDEMMREHMIEDTIIIDEREASCMYCVIPISSDEGSFRGIIVLSN